MQKRSALAVVLLALAAPLGAAEAKAGPASPNPFLEEWTTPFGVPPFDRIQAEHYLPAYQEAIARQKKAVEAIVASAEPPTFANTLEPLDLSGEMLWKVDNVFTNLSSAETNERMQAVAKEVAPLLAAARDDIRMNGKLFARIKAVWERRAGAPLDAEQQKLLGDTYRQFVRGGANLDAKGKERLRAINAELATLGLRFGDNLLAETNGYRLVVDRSEALAGLPPAVVEAAGTAAKAAGLEGKWVFTLHAPSIWPFLQAADDRELRRQILTAYVTRADHGDERDNKATLSRIACLRSEKAKLLGYATWADYVLDENMAKRPERVYALLRQLWAPALAVARKEAADLQEAVRKDGKDFSLEPWDWRYYTEKVRKTRYDLDDEALRPYFALDNVRQGAFDVARKLWGLSFTERKDIPVYHPEVKAFEVKDADGSHVGVFLVDYHPRPGKRGGAWMNNYRDQYVARGKEVRPVVSNVGNFSRPTAEAPALLSLDEVETLFHEFGHGLHGLLARGRYRSLTGTSVAADFVELPSQIMENWAREPQVLKAYARHWKTGEPIPDALVGKLQASARFDQGFATVEYLAACFLDMDWHTIPEPVEHDATAFEKKSLDGIGLVPQIVSRYRSPYFNHIFGGDGGYSAGYYDYVWAEVLDADAFEAFKEKGIFDQATARAFRTNILEKGGTEEAMELYRRFRGQEPSVEPLLARRGLK